MKRWDAEKGVKSSASGTRLDSVDALTRKVGFQHPNPTLNGFVVALATRTQIAWRDGKRKSP